MILPLLLQQPPHLPNDSRLYLGVDLGKHSDHTALSAIEFRTVTTGSRDPATYSFITTPKLNLRFLQRLPLGTSYPAIAQHIHRTLAKPEFLHRTTLIIDASGPGLAFLDFFTRPAATLQKVYITASGRPSYSAGFYHISRRVLLENLAVLLERRALSVCSRLAKGQDLRHELSALATNGQSHAPHDDLAMATALAAWFAARRHPPKIERGPVSIPGC